MEQVLHLFITNTCRHNCPLCCNKFYKIDEIPVVTVELLKSVQTVCLTGGDPLSINPVILVKFINNLRRDFKNIESLYIYTSGKEAMSNLKEVLDNVHANAINGINFAPKDIEDIMGTWSAIKENQFWFTQPHRSNRLYAFKDMRLAIDNMMMSLCPSGQFGPLISVIDRQWTKTFNTPENEHFARLPILF